MKSPLLLGSDAPHVHPRPRKHLSRCTLDCGFKTSESPALRGFEAERGPITGTSLYLVLKSNGLHRPKIRLKKFGFLPIDTPANIAKKLPSQHCSKPLSSRFSTSPTNGPHLLSRVKVGTLSPFGEESHTRAYTAQQGAFRMGALSLPSERSARFGNSAWPGVRTAYFAAFGSWLGVLSKNAESLRDSDAFMRVAVPRRRGPAGLRDLFRFCRNCGLYALCSELSACARWGALSLPSARFACSRNAGRPLVKTTCLPFSEVDGHCSPRDAYFLANIQVSLSVISVANVFALWYDKSHKSGLFGDEGEPE